MFATHTKGVAMVAAAVGLLTAMALALALSTATAQVEPYSTATVPATTLVPGTAPTPTGGPPTTERLPRTGQESANIALFGAATLLAGVLVLAATSRGLPDLVGPFELGDGRGPQHGVWVKLCPSEPERFVANDVSPRGIDRPHT